MKTFGTLFSGFGLADCGYKAAGLTPVCAVEIDPVLAEVYRANHGDHITVADVCDVDFKKLERPDVLHASPVCKNASVAKAGGEESGIDIATAEATARAIETWLPETVFIENVWGYRKFRAFDLLCEALTRCGYWFQVHHLNSADFGVPQTRKRLIVRATRKGWLPPLPNKTRWVGWYEAIEDLIPSLPESKFAQWQLERLPEGFAESVIIEGDCAGPRPPTAKGVNSPIWTLKANAGEQRQNTIRAFLVGDQHRQLADAPEPAFTVRAGENGGAAPRAFICHDTEQRNMPVRAETEPVWTLKTNVGRASHMPRAFISDSLNYSSTNPNRWADEPVMTVTCYSAKHPGPRAFICEGSAAGTDNAFTMPVRTAEEPVFTMRARQNNPRAWLSQGRVVSMTPRALGRFQTLPDSFELSGKTAVDCTGIGNGVPCLLAQKLMEGLL